MKIFKTSIAKNKDDITYTRLFEMDKHILRISIRSSDKYRQQCHAKAYRWDGVSWYVISSIETTNMATPRGLAYNDYNQQELERRFIDDDNSLVDEVKVFLGVK